MSTTQTKNPFAVFQFRKAKIKNVYDDIRVIVGSEEKIFADIYMTGLVANNRPVKFKKEALEFV